jgi:hypothetical protein
MEKVYVCEGYYDCDGLDDFRDHYSLHRTEEGALNAFIKKASSELAAKSDSLSFKKEFFSRKESAISINDKNNLLDWYNNAQHGIYFSITELTLED